MSEQKEAETASNMSTSLSPDKGVNIVSYEHARARIKDPQWRPSLRLLGRRLGDPSGSGDPRTLRGSIELSPCAQLQTGKNTLSPSNRRRKHSSLRPTTPNLDLNSKP